MMRSIDTILSCAIVVAGVVCTTQVLSWARATSALRRERESLAAVEAAAAEIEQLRRRPALIGERPTPNERFVGMASEAAAQAALGTSAIKSVEAEQESAATSTLSGTSTSVRKQSVRIAMDSVVLPDIGRFLERWRSLHPSWTPARIDLTPAQATTKPVAGSDSLPKWNVRLAFTNVYLPE